MKIEPDPELIRQLRRRLLIVGQNGNDFDIVTGDRFRFDAFEAIATVLIIQVGICPERQRHQKDHQDKPGCAELECHNKVPGLPTDLLRRPEFGGSIAQGPT